MMTEFLVDLFNALGVGLFFIMLPYSAGRLFFPHDERDKGLIFLVGMFAAFTVFELVYLPCFFLKLPFQFLTVIYFVIAAAAFVIGYLVHYGKKALPAQEKKPLNRSEKICAGVFALVFIFQVHGTSMTPGIWPLPTTPYTPIKSWEPTL